MDFRPSLCYTEQKSSSEIIDLTHAVKGAGFAPSPDSLIGWDGRVYGDYWTMG